MTVDKTAALKRSPLFAELDETTIRVLSERAIERWQQMSDLQKIAVDLLLADEPGLVFIGSAGGSRMFPEVYLISDDDRFFDWMPELERFIEHEAGWRRNSVCSDDFDVVL